IREDNSALVDELIPNLLSIGEIQKVLSNLLDEGVSIRDMESILETLADYSVSTRDIDMLTEYARQSLSRYITKKFAEQGEMRVITIDSGLEQTIMNSINKSEAGSYISLDPNTIQRIIEDTITKVEKLAS